eukprot:gene3664-4562_t
MILTIVLIVVIYLAYSFKVKNFRRSDEAPAVTSISWPIIGDLSLLKSGNPHFDFYEISKKYPKCFRLFMGDNYTVVINDPMMIREIWVKNFDNFVNRPHYPSMAINSFDYNDLAFADEEMWRNSKALIGNLFTKTSLKQMATNIIENEGINLVDYLKEITKTGQPVNPAKYCKIYALNIILKYLFSESVSYEDVNGKIDQLIKDVEQLFIDEGTARIDDVVNLLKPFSYLIRKYITNVPIKKVLKHIDGYYEQHKANLDPENPKDFFDTLIIESEINKKISPLTARLIAVDIIAAATDTSSGTISNLFMCLANYPETQKKAYDELVRVIGKGNRVKNSDRYSTPYVNAIMKELLRYKTIAPLSVPRAASADIIIDGVFIPKDTQLIQNIYTCHHSEEYWEKPFEFNPDRFLKPSSPDRPNEEGQAENLAYIPFGVGSRNCIGFSLAYDEMYNAMANIIMNFEIQSVNNEKIDESEVFGMVVYPKHPYQVKLIPRN